MSSLIPTVFICLFIIGIYFVYYRKDLTKIKSFLQNPLLEFKDLDDKYNATRQVERDGKLKTYSRADDFINIETIYASLKVNSHRMNSASSFLTGLGVLGTFFGLTLSLVGFKADSSETIQEGIKQLLSGTWMAFATSLFGMLFSLIYIWRQKRLLNELDKFISGHNENLDKDFLLSPADIISIENERHEKYLSELFSFTDDEGEHVNMGGALRTICEQCEKQSVALQSFTTDLSTQLNASLEQTMGAAMNTSIVPIIRQLEDAHKQLNEKFDVLSNSIKQPASDATNTMLIEMRETMTNMIDEFKHTISDNATGQLEALADKLANMGELLNSVPTNVQNMTTAISSSFNNIKMMVESMQKTTEETTGNTMNKMQEQTILATDAISQLKLLVGSFANVIAEVKSAATTLSSSSNGIVSTTGLLKNSTDEFAKTQQTFLAHVSALQENTNSSLQNALQVLQGADDTAKEYASKFAVIENGLQNIFKQIQSGVEQYSKTVGESTGLLLGTYSEKLSECVKQLESFAASINDTTEDLVETLENKGFVRR